MILRHIIYSAVTENATVRYTKLFDPDESGSYNEKRERLEQGKAVDKYLFLDPKNDNEVERITAQAISLDIRGNYGVFLNDSRINSFKNRGPYEENVYEDLSEGIFNWQGNIYNIQINYYGRQRVIISEVNNEAERCTLELNEFIEALEDWKNFYLKELGFLEFDRMSMNHLMGVMLLTYDHLCNDLFTEIYHDSIDVIVNDIVKYAVNDAVKKCAERFGVALATITRDCRKMTGVYNMSVFYKWIYYVMINEKYVSSAYASYDELRSIEVMHEYVMGNISRFCDDISFDVYLKYYFEYEQR